MQYDSYKVQAVLNEIDGFDHSGTTKVGTPAIFGMNFQTVSTAEKLPTSDGLAGGYLADGVTPGPLLARALDYVDAQLGAMLHEIKSDGLRNEHRDRALGQARAVARHSVGADADPRRPDHRRTQRSLDGGTSRRRRPRRVLGQRRRDADLAARPLRRGNIVRQGIPARPLGSATTSTATPSRTPVRA